MAAESQQPSSEPSPHTIPKGTHSNVPITHIRPTRGWFLLKLNELWAYRALLYLPTWCNIKVRYKQMVLGGSWAAAASIFRSQFKQQ